MIVLPRMPRLPRLEDLPILGGPPPARSWPGTAAAMAAAMGYGTWASAWQCEEAASPLADAYGAVSLAAAGTPTYRNAGGIPGEYAVGYDSTLDRFEGGTADFNIDASGSIGVYLCAKFTAMSGFQLVIGKGIASASAYWGITSNGTGNTLSATISDGVGSVGSVVSANHVDGAWHDLLMVIDRSDNTMRLRTDLGAGTDSNISAIGSPSNARAFHLGATTVFSAPASTVAFCAIATGDLTALKANGATAIANIRAYTGRG